MNALLSFDKFTCEAILFFTCSAVSSLHSNPACRRIGSATIALFHYSRRGVASLLSRVFFVSVCVFLIGFNVVCIQAFFDDLDSQPLDAFFVVE